MPNPKSKIPRPDAHQSRGGHNPTSAEVVEITSTSVEETQVLGERLGRILKPGDVVALYGELGSGKTTLTQGLARGLGYDPERIKSPTFVLMREYAPILTAERAARPGDHAERAGGAGGAIPLVHIDGYRLEGAPAVAWLDVELIFAPSKVTVIEWAERFAGLLPDERLEVHLTHVSTNRRRLALTANGDRSREALEALRAIDEPANQPTG